LESRKLKTAKTTLTSNLTKKVCYRGDFKGDKTENLIDTGLEILKSNQTSKGTRFLWI